MEAAVPGAAPAPHRYLEPTPAQPEVPLLGGDVTQGLVRVGQTVRRPPERHSPLVRAVLRHLERVGFDGAPRWLGVDALGREVLTYLPGEVAGRPAPPWVLDHRRMASVAHLLRDYHHAMAGFELPAHLEGTWQLPDLPPDVPELGEPVELVCHRDITRENVVFRDGVAVALIDFDLAAPGSRLLDVVNALTHWGQLKHPYDRTPGLSDSEVFSLCRTFVDAYGLEQEARVRIPELAVSLARRSWHLMRHRADVLGGGWLRMWQEGVGEVINRRRSWLSDDRDRVAAALTVTA